MACSRLNQPSLLTSKTRSNSRGSLSGRKWLRSMPGGVQQHVDAPAALAHLLDDFGDASAIGEVDAEVVRRSAGGPHCVDGASRSLRALQRRQFLFHQRRSGSFAACLNAGEQIALQSFLVGDEALRSGLFGIGLRHQVEQIERAAGCRGQVGGDGGDDASCRARDQENGAVSSVRPGWPSAAGCFLAVRWSSARRPLYPISTAPGSRRVSSIRISAISVAVALRLRNRPLSPGRPSARACRSW